MGVKYSLAEVILKFAEQQKILDKYYLVKCPDCDYTLDIVTKDEVAGILMHPIYCDECDEDKNISVDNVYIAYKVVLQPDITEDELIRAIEERLNQGECAAVNFSKADSLLNRKEDIYEIYYNPSESAYDKFSELRDKLDLDYGNNTTAKGKALEELILYIFNSIKYVRGSNDVKTKTNQFDCTILCGINTVYLSVFNYLAPCFIIECKNEPEKKPDNTYINKLESIMETNDAQFGIVFGRIKATRTCFAISREHYLLNKKASKQKIIVTCCDDDLKYIIDKKVNLLQYMEYKIFQVTSNSPTATYEMFNKDLSVEDL